MWKSSFEREPKQAPEPKFLSPEEFGELMGASDPELLDAGADLAQASMWDIAVRYHDFKSRKHLAQKAKRLRQISARAILERAQAVLGSVVHPTHSFIGPLGSEPPGLSEVELELEETLEANPWIGSAERPAIERSDIWISWQQVKTQSVILAVDTSLSMTGEKLALTAVALAVVLLQFPEDPIGVVAFENSARILKRPSERITIGELVERFLDVPAQGYTHLEEGMKAALQLSRLVPAGARSKPPSTVLLTDGKYTAGRDPAYLAPRFSHLEVLKMGDEKGSLELCQELARGGRGALREVGELEDLPSTMYGVVKDLLRGRSHG